MMATKRCGAMSLMVIPAQQKKAASYTSGRVSTQNKQTFIYGRFECRAKVPKGHGYLPAFTLS